MKTGPSPRRLQKIVWTWDMHVCDVTSADEYVRSYTLMLDFLAEHHFDAVIIWGFLRDSHGGVAAARAIAAHGKAVGVKVLPGIGLFSYGGVYYEGNSPYSYAKRLVAAPQSKGEGLPGCETLCQSREENIQWYRDGLSWLYKTIPEIGGVHFETGDSSTNMCWCARCREATKKEVNRGRDYSGSIVDMLRIVPPLCEHICSLDPETWPTYATYNCFWSKPSGVVGNCESVLEADRLALLKAMPKWITTSWCKGLWQEFAPPKGAECPGTDNNWVEVWFNPSLDIGERQSSYFMQWAFPCFNPRVEGVYQLAARTREVRCQGISLATGYLPTMPDNEITLMAAARFADDPEADPVSFLDEALPPLYGSAAAAEVRDLMLFQERELSRILRAYFLCTVMPFCHHAVLGGYGWFPGIDLNRVGEIPKLVDRQIARARSALGHASPSGKSRLAKILGLLETYRTIADWISREPGLSFFRSMAGLQEGSLAELTDEEATEHLKLYNVAAESWRGISLPSHFQHVREQEGYERRFQRARGKG